jgi:hypothetical protein
MSAVSIGARDLGLRAGIDAAFESNSPSGDAARDRRLDHGREALEGPAAMLDGADRPPASDVEHEDGPKVITSC